MKLCWCDTCLAESLRCRHAAAVERWGNMLSMCSDLYLMQLEFPDKEHERHRADRLRVRGYIRECF